MIIEIVGRRAECSCECGYFYGWEWPFHKEVIGTQETEIMRRVCYVKGEVHREVCPAAQLKGWEKGGPNWSRTVSIARKKGQGHYAPVRLAERTERPASRGDVGAW